MVLRRSRDTHSVDVRLAYGEEGLIVRFPDDRTVVIAPENVPSPALGEDLVRRALDRPVAGPRLRDLVARGQRVAIAVCDLTRPQPREEILSAVLDELSTVVDAGSITVLIATGTHRANTRGEILEMLGTSLAERVEVVNHDCRDESSLVWCGELGDGVPVWLNRIWMDADVRIATGLVEPHFFAGFSGGPKMVAPGLAGLRTILTLHNSHRIKSPEATWGVLHGNPVHDDVRAIAAATGVTFSIDVVINRDHRVVGAFAGELFGAHREACAAARSHAMVPVKKKFPLVVTTCAGYPLDQNLYQSVKGMSAAASIVERHGTIVCAAECRDGFPDHGSYRHLLESMAEGRSSGAPEPSVARPDQWQVEIQRRVQSHASVVMHTGYLSDEELARAGLRQTSDISSFVEGALRRAGPGAEVCVLPEGPRTVPYLCE